MPTCIATVGYSLYSATKTRLDFGGRCGEVCNFGGSCREVHNLKQEFRKNQVGQFLLALGFLINHLLHWDTVSLTMFLFS